MAKTATISRKSHKSKSVVKVTLADRMSKIVEVRGNKKTREELKINKMSVREREEWMAKRIFRKLLAEIREAAERGEISLEYFLRRNSADYTADFYFGDKLVKLLRDKGFTCEMILYNATRISASGTRKAEFEFVYIYW